MKRRRHVLAAIGLVGRLYGLLLISLASILALRAPEPLMRWVNRHNSPAADSFFQAVTWLGDGWFTVAVLLVLLCRSYRRALLVLFSYALSGLLVQLGKHLLFPGSPRPAQFFKATLHTFHTVDGVVLHHFGSLPSGHTATAFALFTILALESRGWGWQGWYLMLACLVGYSRVYLFQHFVLDVAIGSVLGVLSGLAAYGLLGWWQRRSPARWLDRGLLVRSAFGPKPAL